MCVCVCVCVIFRSSALALTVLNTIPRGGQDPVTRGLINPRIINDPAQYNRRVSALINTYVHV